ncbi:MAG TPA: hypothetical protein DCS93_29030 [Microscillaceae bacterium]|nr:hypothetical protein [Microscillaceae bacterium]
MTPEEKAKEALKRNEAIQLKLKNLMQELGDALDKTKQVNEEDLLLKRQTTAYAPSDKRAF